MADGRMTYIMSHTCSSLLPL